MKQPKILLINRIAFCFWFFFIFRVATIYLFFSNNPARGSLFNAAMTMGFVYIFLTLSMMKGRTKRLRGRKTPFTVKLIFLYLIWAGFTILWSHVESRFSALGYWGQLVAGVLSVYLLMSIDNSDQIIQTSLIGVILGGVFVALVAILMTKGAGLRLGNAEFLHPNLLGHTEALAALCAVYLIISRRQIVTQLLLSFCLLMILFALFLSLSKTAIIAFGIAALCFYLISSAISFKKKILISIVTLLVFTVVWQKMAVYVDQYIDMQGGERLQTLSGRTLVWYETWEMIKQNPIIGYGFMSFRGAGPQPFFGPINEAHNEIFNQWFTLGVPGLTLLIGIYVSVIKILKKSHRFFPSYMLSYKRILGVTLLIYALIRGIADASVVDLNFPLPLMLLLVLSINNSRRELPTKTQTNHFIKH